MSHHTSSAATLCQGGYEAYRKQFGHPESAIIAMNGGIMLAGPDAPANVNPHASRVMGISCNGKQFLLTLRDPQSRRERIVPIEHLNFNGVTVTIN